MRDEIQRLAATLFPHIAVVEDDGSITEVTPAQTLELAVQEDDGWGVPDFDEPVPSLEDLKALADAIEPDFREAVTDLGSIEEGLAAAGLPFITIDENSTQEDFFSAIGAALGLTVPEIQYWHPEVLVQHGAQTEDSRITVAYMPFEGELAFAIAYCSPNDQFNRKLGRELATQRLYEGEAVTVPTRGLLTNSQCRQLIESFVDLGHLTGPPHFPENQQLTVLS